MLSSILTKRNILLTILLICTLLGIVGVSSYLSSFKKIVVIYRNIEKVSLYKVEGDGKRIEITSNVTSNKEISVSKNENYEIRYKGKYPYGSGRFFIDTNKDKVIIYPYYSTKKLNELLKVEFPLITSVLNNHYKNMDMYKMQKGKMYFYGEWYATTLQYIGNDPSYSDTLRVVLKKEGDQWVVKTDPPSIVLSKLAFPNIPKSILSDINNTYTPMDGRFIDKNSINYSPY